MQAKTNKHFATVDKYTLHKKLGEGGFAKVKLAHDSTNNCFYAVKIIKHSHPEFNLQKIRGEIKILSSLEHSNVVKIVNFYEDVDYVKKNGGSYKVTAIVMELVSNGDLCDLIMYSGRLSEKVARTFFKALIQVVSDLHSKLIVHRDIKTENILLDNDFNLKITDFGVSTQISEKDSTLKYTGFAGTENYQSPEVRRRESHSGPGADLYACAISLFVMITGVFPFTVADPDKDRYYSLIHKGQLTAFWKVHERQLGKGFFSEDFKNFFCAMLSPDASKRLSVSEITEHPWFNGPIVDESEIKAEFTKRVNDVKVQKEKEREEKERIRLAREEVKMEMPLAYKGVKVTN